MKKIFLFLFLFIITGVIGAGWFFYELGPVNADKTSHRFVIIKGETAAQIGKDLEKERLIKSGFIFRIFSQVTGSAKSIKPGSYEITSNLGTPQIIDKLLSGPTEVWVTIPEGLRREEIVDRYIEGLGLTGKAADDFKNQFLQLTVGKEGYLFPDTYLLLRNEEPNKIVDLMETTFDKKYASIKDKQSVKITREEIVNIASIVQREAISEDDMKGVASVLENRLNLGIALGSDVTLEYALGKQPDGNWWKKDLTIDDLKLNSAYNTRLNAGLPPTPISNPGLVALEAALNPPQTDYLYYLSDKDGKLHFAKTLDEHNANIAKYLQ